MADLNRQQICAELGVSESTIRRLELAGLPYTPVGARSKRYDLAECKKWLREQEGRFRTKRDDSSTAELTSAEIKFIESARKMKIRVKPS